jgi:superfamily I DNA/RNA helicase
MAVFIPTPEQQNIIDTDSSAIVIAGPGTGKTRTAIEKAKLHCVRLDPSKRQRVLFLSFSNSAVHRLADAAAVTFSRQERRMLRFMTYHSYAAELLRQYGRFAGLPPKVQIMDTIEQALTLLEKSIEFTDGNKFEVLRALAKQGRLGFDVLIPFAITLLGNTPKLRGIVTRYHPLVMVDEFQDTSEDQWLMLQLLGANCQVVAFGDPNQIIYASLHGATVRRFDEFLTWKGLKPSGFSRHNFRCEQKDILDFAESLLSAKPYQPPAEAALEIVTLQYRTQLRSALAVIWKAIQEQGGINPSVGIIVPSNAIADDIAVALRSPPEESPVKIRVFARLIADGAAYDSVILALLACRDYATTRSALLLRKLAMALHAMDIHWNRRKKMTLKSVNQLEKSVAKLLSDDQSLLSLLLPRLPTITDFNAVVPAFIAAAGALNEIEGSCRRIASHGRLPLPRIVAGEQLELFDSVRQSRTARGLDGHDTGVAKTEIITYHRAKGREFDFVLMVVDPRKESSKSPIDEARRLYYVCATRAKLWLGVLCYRNDLGRVLGPVLAASEE